MIKVLYLCPYCNSKNIEGLVKLWININNNLYLIVKDNSYHLCIDSPIHCKDCNKTFAYDEIKIDLGDYTRYL